MVTQTTVSSPKAATAASAATALPDHFEAFADARKLSFIKAKEFKESGGRLAGYLCSFAPLEALDAGGLAAVGLCGTSNETVPDAETVLPKNLCPLIKSTYGFALTQKCPFTYFSDIIIGETTCDGKKKMYELLADLKPVYVLQLPQGQQRPYAAEIWKKELELFIAEIEQRFAVQIDDAALRQAATRRNRLRQALVELYALQQATPPMMSGVEIMTTILQGAFSFDIEEYTEKLQALVAEKRAAYAAGQRPVAASARRILLTGCPSGGLVQKVGMAIEENGGVIVCLDDCMGERTNRLMVDDQAEDICQAISDRYLEIHCAVMSPNATRQDNLLELIKRYQVDGVIELVLQACHPFNIESAHISTLLEQHDIPYMKLETDYSPSDSGQLQTRIAAFIETLAQ
ncbi:MAG: 2-hydroxyacyl-CoA dehydratase family protein [Coriobacteriales bacterium]|jgi:benzoyl-CoA reductase/2-hydroxyglutaryl-CoA dehydratase subunit BcrC/BadD/HgdB|nr:2-hydroxyacyl-CoA dehydratase family protein [Coriobacteriales bacterium]